MFWSRAKESCCLKWNRAGSHCRTTQHCIQSNHISQNELMDPFIHVRNFYIQGAPVKVVIDGLKQCSDWDSESFQERVVNEVFLSCYNYL